MNAPCRRHRAPYDILRAQDLILHADLPKKLRDTLAELVAHIRRGDPTAAITAHFDTLASALGCSTKTISRHLQQLEEAGWIRLGDQGRVGQRGRFRSGRFSGRPVYPTELLLDRCELQLAGKATMAPQDKMSDGHTLTVNPITNRQPPLSDKGIPADLKFLEGKLQRWGIFALMRLASQAGKRLGDIVAVAAVHLAKLELTGRRLFAYLKKLATNERDYAFEARQRQQQVQENAQQAAQADAAANFKAEHAGRVLAAPDGSVVVEIEPSAEFARIVKPGRTSGSTPLTTALVDELQRALAAGKLVAA